MRVTPGPATRKSHKNVLKKCKGFRHGRKNLFKRANEALISALSHAYTDRKKKKGNYRALWITRINAAVRQINEDYSYSRFMSGLKKADVLINRKMLAELAVNNEAAFARLVEMAMEVQAQPA